MRNLGFLNKHDSFLNRLGMYDIQNSTPIFFLLDSCPKIKLYGKEKKSFDWKKKTKNKGKIKRYLLLKCKTIKTLLFEREETNYKSFT